MTYAPSRSSRKYLYNKGLAFRSEQIDRPYPQAVPGSLPAVSQPVPTLLLTAETDVQYRRYGDPDLGTTPIGPPTN